MGAAAAEPAFEAAAQSAKQGIDPSNDIHATEEYRRSVAATLTKRALRSAVQKLGKN
jgi:CO/xanthine dehydrogenase FAD-binding subunit